jgi:hypothetical protein
LNSNNSGYLRSLESEFNEGSNAIRLELNRFENAGLLKSSMSGNKKIFKSNVDHPMFGSLQSLVRKYIGIDQIIEGVVNNIGDLDSVYLSGKIARGLDSKIIELIIVGKEIDRIYLQKLVVKAEELIKKKISFVVFNEQNFEEFIKDSQSDVLMIWNK